VNVEAGYTLAQNHPGLESPGNARLGVVVFPAGEVADVALAYFGSPGFGGGEHTVVEADGGPFGPRKWRETERKTRKASPAMVALRPNALLPRKLS